MIAGDDGPLLLDAPCPFQGHGAYRFRRISTDRWFGWRRESSTSSETFQYTCCRRTQRMMPKAPPPPVRHHKSPDEERSICSSALSRNRGWERHSDSGWSNRYGVPAPLTVRAGRREPRETRLAAIAAVRRTEISDKTAPTRYRAASSAPEQVPASIAKQPIRQIGPAAGPGRRTRCARRNTASCSTTRRGS